MSILLRKSILIPLTQFVSALITGAMELLIGETQGYAIDATSINNRSYIGGPDGGEVACRDTSTPANDLSNVPLDSSNLTQSGTSPKIVNWNTFSGPHNLLAQSQTLDNTTTWTTDGVTITANSTTAPDGTATADTVAAAAGTAAHDLIYGLGTPLLSNANIAYTFSVYAKQNANQFFRMRFYDGLTYFAKAWFDLSNGTVTSSSGGTASIIDAGNGWYRCVFVATWLASATSEVHFGPSLGSSTDWDYTTTSQSTFVWGAQLNIGSLTTYVPTTATVSGGVRWTPHNLATQSQTFDNAVWSLSGTSRSANSTAAPDGSITADTLTATAGNAEHYISADTGTISFDADVNYTFSVYMKAASAWQFFTISLVDAATGTAWVAATFDIIAGSLTQSNAGAAGTFIDASVTNVGKGWFRFSVTGRNTSGGAGAITVTIVSTGTPSFGAFGSLVWTAAGTESCYLWGAQQNRGPVATPYLVTTTTARVGIPQGYDVANSKFGMLIEPAATNVVFPSENLTGDWATDNVTISADNTAGPDGTTTADTITCAATNANHGAYWDNPTATTTASTDVTVSAFVKAGTNRYVILTGSDNTNTTRWYSATFDLTSGAVTQTNAGAAGTFTRANILSIGNGWYRLSVTGFTASTNTAMSIEFSNTGTPSPLGNFSNYVFNAAGTETISVWGMQIEQGSFATTYVPTVAATSTRAVDNVRALVSTMPYSQTNGTAYVDYICHDTETLFQFSDGDSNDCWEFYQDGGFSPNRATLFVADGGVTQAQINAGDCVLNIRNQATCVAKTNDFSASFNNGAVVVDTSGTLEGAITVLTLGDIAETGDSNANSYIYRFVYVPRRVSDAQLPTWRYNYP